MKLLICLFISGVTYGQKADSIKKAQQRQDSILINAVTQDMKATLYGKVPPAYYDAFNDMIKEYMKQKQVQWNAKPK